jgi:hypothetical protein
MFLNQLSAYYVVIECQIDWENILIKEQLIKL